MRLTSYLSCKLNSDISAHSSILRTLPYSLIVNTGYTNEITIIPSVEGKNNNQIFIITGTIYTNLWGIWVGGYYYDRFYGLNKLSGNDNAQLTKAALGGKITMSNYYFDGIILSNKPFTIE